MEKTANSKNQSARVLTKKSAIKKGVKHPKHEWTPEQCALLGQISDGALARQLSIQTAEVFMKRTMLGIESARNKVLRWGPKEIALLGNYPDLEVAKRLKTTYRAVTNKRTILRIPSYSTTAGHYHFWTDDQLAMLGNQRDTEIAEKIGISAPCVTAKRNRLKIAPFVKRKAKNRPHKTINDWTKKEIALLGKFTDREVAEKLNLGSATVRLKRLSLGLPPRRVSGSRKSSWSPAILNRLGRESDRAIAREIGVTFQAVSYKRKTLGIPIYRKPR